VDLVVTASPDAGIASVQAGDSEQDLEPEVGPVFVACIGTVVATFSPLRANDVCPSAKPVFRYPLRVDLAR
jgi:hypothetical protein